MTHKQAPTGKALIIVESPTKIKTLKKYVPQNFVFESSLGHIRDLPQKGFGIDVDNHFEPEYQILPEKEATVDRLKKAAKSCDIVYLAPDPDREGEAIAWHISQILPSNTPIKRVTFNAITKEAVQEAFQEPREINLSLVDAQQARRLLDRIVGYKISPILARRVQRGRKGGSVSAGRVQSVALKFVVDREKEIQEFKPQEYWNITAQFHNKENDSYFSAYLHSVEGLKVEKTPIEGKDVYLISNEAIAKKIQSKLEQSQFSITKADRKEKLRNPVPPFITSTLQQEASRHYGFSAAKTMNIAQSLYEGVEMGSEGSEGLITYMRTDSVRIAPEAIKEIRSYIKEAYGAELLPEKPKSYSSKKAAQDAHEAIRPSTLHHPPETIKDYLTLDQFKLYSLIWKRALASQMKSAVYDTVSYDIETDKNMKLRATGSRLKFKGFLAVYEEKQDEDEESEDSIQLPNLEVGDSLKLQQILSEQAFTNPPPRYSEASLVKELEKSGIGRPSTYASIMSKIQNREYTHKEKGRLIPTDLGIVIAQMLETNFKEIMDVSFTAKMEDELEQIAADEKNWKDLIEEFWKQFIPTVELAEKQAFVPKILTDIDCPKCGHKLMKIWSRKKYFYGCSQYPTCDYSAPLEELSFKKEDYAPDFDWDQPCPKCGGQMMVRHGKYGPFLGCKNYPECKGIVNIPKKGEEIPKEADLPPCPAIGCDGRIVPKRSRFGKIFFSCSNFPDCNVIVNNLDDLATKYAHHEKTPYEKKTKKKAASKTTSKSKTTSTTKKTAKQTTKKRTPRAIKVSKELADFLGKEETNRSEVMKAIWAHIKALNLQDPNNKRLIIPDAKLAKILGQQAPIDMFQMTKLLTRHFK